MTEPIIKLNKIRTSKLTYAALDWVVATCEGYSVSISESGEVIIMREGVVDYFDPHRNWGWGGPIIQREAHNLFKHNGGTEWCCACNVSRDEYTAIVTADGPTPLIAAMRCFVASRLGEEVEVPDDLA